MQGRTHLIATWLRSARRAVAGGCLAAGAALLLVIWPLSERAVVGVMLMRPNFDDFSLVAYKGGIVGLYYFWGFNRDVATPLDVWGFEEQYQRQGRFHAYFDTERNGGGSYITTFTKRPWTLAAWHVWAEPRRLMTRMVIETRPWVLGPMLGVAGAGLLLPDVFARVRSRRRAASGRCVACGYDLRASEHQCPECGRGFKHEGRRKGDITDYSSQ